MSIEKDVKTLISKQLGVSESEVVDDASLVENLGADSLETVELIMAAEEKFGIEILEEYAETLKTVKDVIDYIKNKKGGS
ncbi:acyl carrier protein [Patescibacteria group bacterium]|nr:acyl carrier protein [Patescibacteria group bacterium]